MCAFHVLIIIIIIVVITIISSASIQLIGAEILPIIEVLNPSDTNFVPFYRSVFGLLCHCGQLYPSVITDNVGNTSEADVT